MSISPKLLKHAKIRNSMFLLGKETFQIWEPTMFEKFVQMRKKANLNRASLKWEHQLNK